MSKKPVTTFADLQKTQVPLISDLLNETFVVTGFTKIETPLGKKCTIETDKGTFATFSEVLEQQLDFAEEQKAFPLQVTLRQKKRYFTFE